ncbi:MAG: hypothetical protein HC857_10630 [Synechococcales cyanobacterium RU_4_20]|nr:hypothetical protein [Synechococcales cyanobacterium RU_4_20]
MAIASDTVERLIKSGSGRSSPGSKISLGPDSPPRFGVRSAIVCNTSTP